MAATYCSQQVRVAETALCNCTMLTQMKRYVVVRFVGSGDYVVYIERHIITLQYSSVIHCVQKKTPTHVFFYISVENV